jgi:hypothetical protein
MIDTSPQYCDRMGDFKRKFSILSSGSTCPGDTSSISSSDEFAFVETDMIQTTEKCTFAYSADEPGSPFPVTYFDRSDLLFTYEPYAESPWCNANREANIAEQVQAHGRPHATTEPFELLRNNAALPKVLVAPQPMLALNQSVMLPMNRCGGVPLQMVAALAMQTMPILPPPVHTPPGMMPAPAQKAPLAQPDPLPSSSAPREAPAPAQKDQQKAAPKQNGNVKGVAHAKNQSLIDSMPAEKKEALCKYIYEVMVQKGFTNPEGYLIADVFADVWKEMSDGSGSRAAQQRFSELLRFAPQYFTLFRKSIQVANHCGWFARKGERMVQLVLQEDQ